MSSAAFRKPAVFSIPFIRIVASPELTHRTASMAAEASDSTSTISMEGGSLIPVLPRVSATKAFGAKTTPVAMSSSAAMTSASRDASSCPIGTAALAPLFSRAACLISEKFLYKSFPPG
ncbi:MAG: hypothetical protein BWX47_01704 [candidate division Hyd24-12 bacterium ADurb.Bin004]|nr:MAG: hypothetical protein BWX47_01704 [candidate division Hyd24-12 bacterium ADurb.Bin004]